MTSTQNQPYLGPGTVAEWPQVKLRDFADCDEDEDDTWYVVNDYEEARRIGQLAADERNTNHPGTPQENQYPALVRYWMHIYEGGSYSGRDEFMCAVITKRDIGIMAESFPHVTRW